MYTLVLVALLTFAIFLFVRGCDGTDTKHEESSSGIKWHGEQEILHNYATQYGCVPGFTELTFKSDTVNQRVNFYNPSQNSMAVDMELSLENGDTLWRAYNVQPDYGFYDIELNRPLKSGTYAAQITYKFRSAEGESYNHGTIPFTLFVI